MHVAARHRMTIDEFFAWEEQQTDRHELVDGIPVLNRGMAGASNAHDTLVVNAIVALANRLRGKPCKVRSADTALRTSIRNIRRPDVTVDCATDVKGSYESHRPTVAIEVMSQSTRMTDWVRKLEEFRRHPTMRHILLVEPGTVSVVHFRRDDGGAWVDEAHEALDEIVTLDAVGIELPLADLYEGVALDQPSPSTSAIE